MADVRRVTRARSPDNGDPAVEADQRRTFTGDKLDWMTALSADPRLDARAFEVGFCIAQHVNAQSGRAIVSDDTIGDKTGIPKRWVLRARQSLRDAGWIDWRRTKSANIYWTLGDRINAVTDHQIILKEKRTERQSKARKARQETPPVAHLKYQETPRMALPETPPVAEQETPPVANIHLSSYTLSVTPSKEAGLSAEVVDRGRPSQDHQSSQWEKRRGGAATGAAVTWGERKIVCGGR